MVALNENNLGVRASSSTLLLQKFVTAINGMLCSKSKRRFLLKTTLGREVNEIA
jgi:hypothetical protein